MATEFSDREILETVEPPKIAARTPEVFVDAAEKKTRETVEKIVEPTTAEKKKPLLRTPKNSAPASNLRIVHRAEKKSSEIRSPNFVQKVAGKTKNIFVRPAEKSLTGLKKLSNPYYQSRRDLLDALQGNFRDKNIEEAKTRGHLIIPKWLCGWVLPFGSGNYAGIAIDRILGPLAERAWKTRQKIGSTFREKTVRPRQFLGGKIRSATRKIGRFFLGTERQKRKRIKRYKFMGNLQKQIHKLDAWIKKPVRFGKRTKKTKPQKKHPQPAVTRPIEEKNNSGIPLLKRAG
ncbi:hypothetical protein HN954_00540 [bacterium]|jgi:hypothetical protein|nr:hypothetical protein [bacterium]MBT6832357.1 hypothetical protein [bacterium]MBT6995902.1 hypothetical protein [bacterium]MBT7772763.1 hypothetical protein [bacterium]